MADMHALMYAMDADLLIAVYVVVAFLLSVAIFCQLLKLAWSYLEPLVFMAIQIGDLLIEDVKDWWSDHQERRRRAKADTARARRVVSRSGAPLRRVVPGASTADLTHRVALRQLEMAGQSTAGRSRPVQSSSAPQGGLDPKTAA